ncbi:MAG: DUF1566 domain-containing protein [Micavibrio aeruginosavorus]|uniref:DUF1566 domain-containing protein n=1 Tax=Micavibrio aeruginosavorus TaxID=349221 RepID=A0A7T5R1H0_9BACT|nr:MAG: DUF1566 domain-containing protein [Micavibrio aeruginosavorus]
MIRYLGALLALIYIWLPSSAWAACSNPSGTAGEIVYSATQKHFQYCNDTNWVAMNTKPGSGSGGCANPVLDEGQMVYNIDNRVLQGCAGNIHVAMGPVGGAGTATDWLQISVSTSHACGIKKDRSAWCWGNGLNGRLGNGSTSGISAPVEVSGNYTWKYISAGTSHTCGIQSDDTAWCWGSDGTGQLGNGATSTDQATPVAVSGGGSWLSISAGLLGTCGVKSNGSGYCWGMEITGTLGNGGAASETVNAPTALNDGGATWKFIAAPGQNSTCGIKTNDTGWCWGSQADGKLGDGVVFGGSIVSPTAVIGGHTWKAISVAVTGHTCAIKSDDTIRCWGYGSYGQRGDGTTSQAQGTPAPLSGGGTWKKISAGGASTCAIKNDDTAWCWGNNGYGQVGNNQFSTAETAPVAVAGGGSWSDISIASNATCGIKIGGTMNCWGDNTEGVLNYNATTSATSPLGVDDMGPWQAISGGSKHSCGIKSDGSLWCWGYNTTGQLGNNSILSSNIPVPVNGGGIWKAVSPGGNHTCGIKNDDTVWCWGNNGNGQLGDNSTTQRLIPTAINGGGSWRKISAGSSHTCGIKSDDTLWCWGYNGQGQLGDNSTTQRLIPTSVDGGGSWKTVSASTFLYHTCGIKSDDTLWCWGYNSQGQLGDNSTTQRLIPTAINGGGSWKTINTGSQHSCGTKSDDTTWCWGLNISGQLGDNSTTQRLIPTAINGGGSWKAVFTGNSYTCGIRSDNTAWCWGYNGQGQLGDNSTTQRVVPTLVTGGMTWIDLSAGDSHTCGISNSSQALCWGWGAWGQLGDASSGYMATPQPTDCGSPAGPPGAIVYNSTESVLEYCDGAGWVGITSSGSQAPADPCAGSPSPGTVCDDGSIYAGLSPDGNVKMFTTRCDHGQSWNGTICTGFRSVHAYSDPFAGGYTDTAIVNCATSGACDALGEANTATLVATDADPGTPGFQNHDAASACDLLSMNGRTDWYLPAVPEATVLYTNRAAIGGFDAAGTYWSSSEADTNNAWETAFASGTANQNDKINISYLRCVRK